MIRPGKKWFELAHRNVLFKNFELIFWCTALIALYAMPVSEDHFSLCLYSHLGFDFCPGCGIGHSIHYWLHLDFQRGWEEHYLGIFAIVLIIYRIFKLLVRTKLFKHT